MTPEVVVCSIPAYRDDGAVSMRLKPCRLHPGTNVVYLPNLDGSVVVLTDTHTRDDAGRRVFA